MRLADRKRSIAGFQALYGATINMLMNVFEPMGVGFGSSISATRGDDEAVEKHRPGVLIMETVSILCCACRRWTGSRRWQERSTRIDRRQHIHHSMMVRPLARGAYGGS